MINTCEPIHSVTIKDEDQGPSHSWTILTRPGTYIGNIVMIFTVCIAIYCFKRFQIRPATPSPQPYSPVSLWHAIVDDDIEVAPTYRCRGMVEEPWRPHKNHNLHIKHEATRLESHCKQPALAKGIPIANLLSPKAKIQGTQKTHQLFVRLRFWSVYGSYFWIGEQCISNSPLIPQYRLTARIGNQLQHLAGDILQRTHFNDHT